MTGLARLARARLQTLGAPSVAVPAPSPAAPSPDPAAIVPDEKTPFSLTFEGEYWAITHEGKTFRLNPPYSPVAEGRS
jgi:hypothetical protein